MSCGILGKFIRKSGATQPPNHSTHTHNPIRALTQPRTASGTANLTFNSNTAKLKIDFLENKKISSKTV